MADSSATSKLTVTVTVKHKEDVALSASDLIRRRSTDPGGSVSYSIKVENLGVNAHVVNLALSGTQASWAKLNKTTAVLQGGASTLVKVTVTIPEGTT
ncbi:MAG: hypothetical protein GWN18_14085, partial [Thermoplasmata archaeon]|nr:hypothetical protein [Thermoplasmata archaeon]NIS13194.1 hypothetical protein [Thermoplasmata archaeon]NIS21084.1 hypothetical protein [Thermoplasmata archaeon]NIT78561.1 hypothetical protein [Thermoplasmata archaeon]NIU50135.1 hypothetical protein [Thermoplasmata archaeon]